MTDASATRPEDVHPVRDRHPSPTVRELLVQALEVVLNNPEAAHISISKAAWLLEAETAAGEEPYRLLAIPGTLNAWQERRAKQLLEDGLAGDCPIEAVARACDLPLAQFNRAFQRTTGLTPLRWQRALRIERAKDLLYSSKLSLAQITYECGFADQAHFTRAFAAATGTCPGAWRRSRRAG